MTTFNGDTSTHEPDQTPPIGRPSGSPHGQAAAKASPSLTGDWSGQYDYCGGNELNSSFLARIYDDGGTLGGEMIEPNRNGRSGSTRSSIEGKRYGASVEFTKFGTPWSITFNSVDYTGMASENGNTIKGEWSFLFFDGPFEMHREAIVSQKVENTVGEGHNVISSR